VHSYDRQAQRGFGANAANYTKVKTCKARDDVVSGFGDKLRREREMRGVSLEEIAESTKIGTRSLRALEEDDFEKLPGGIFNKGFVRAYSRFLGLDEEETITDFEAAFKEYKLANGYPDDRQIEQEPEPEPSKTPWLIIAALFLIVTVAVAGYFFKGKILEVLGLQSKSAPVSQAAPSVSLPSTSTTPISSAAESPAVPARSAIEPKTGQSTQVSKPASASSSEPDSTPTSGSGKGEANSNGALASNLSSPIRLEVFAREDSWLSVSADGKNLGQQVLAAQKSRTIRAQKEVRLKLGNAGGVEISFNGKPVSIDGEPNQVKELTFTPDGLRQ
jgi:cytoskeleton protein RodZ